MNAEFQDAIKIIIKVTKLEQSSNYNATDEDLKRKWTAFLDRGDVHSLKNVFICERHFLKKNEKCSRLAMEKNSVPTILPRHKIKCA